VSVRVRHTVDRLDRNMRSIPRTAATGFAKAVRANALEGNRRAKRYAQASSGKHGKHYPRSFSAEAVGPLSWEYGPDSSKPQGGMSFEMGSRNQPPHRDLAQSAAGLTAPLASDVRDVLDRLFW
jgi:hypothetical protein